MVMQNDMSSRLRKLTQAQRDGITHSAFTQFARGEASCAGLPDCGSTSPAHATNGFNPYRAPACANNRFNDKRIIHLLDTQRLALAACEAFFHFAQPGLAFFAIFTKVKRQYQ